jgi:MFS family permease
MFLPLVVTLSLIQVPRTHQHPGASAQSAWLSLVEALNYVRSQPILLGLLAMVATPTILVGTSFHSMLPYFADRVFKTGATGYSFLLMASGIGAIFGALALAFMRSVAHKGKIVLGCALAHAVLIILFSLSSWYVPAVIGGLLLALGGMAYAIYQTSMNTLLQLAAPDAIRGRVMGLYSLSTFGLQIFNGPAVGTIAVLLSVTGSLTIFASAIVAVTVAILMKVPALRRME